MQEIIESRVEKRTKGVYVPNGGKKMVTFLDDLNMPAVDEFGSQPPLELLRLWLDYGFWYDRQKQIQKCVKVSKWKAWLCAVGNNNRLCVPVCVFGICLFPKNFAFILNHNQTSDANLFLFFRI